MATLKKSLSVLLLSAALAVAPLAHSFAAEEEGGKPKAEGGGEGGNDVKQKKSGDDVSGGKFAGDPIYVRIDPMLLPVITDKGVEQLVTIIFAVEVKDFDTADSMHTQMPKVRDSLMRALYGGLGQGSLRDGKIADVTKIKSKAVSAVGEVVGAANVKDVLVQGIAQRML